MSAREHARPLPSLLLLAILGTGAACADPTAATPPGADAALAPPARVRANHTPAPTSVTIAASFQSEVGCPGDWQPECPSSRLTYDASDDVWQGAFILPTGSWEYKVALNGSWSENYGIGGAANGPNIPVNLATTGTVRFYYSHRTHWATDDVRSVIATAAGSFQSEVGCPGDWDPSCLRSWLQDPDGDGLLTYATGAIPPGAYEFKVAIGESWSENYGQAGAPNGANVPFTVPDGGATVTFGFSTSSNIPTVVVTPNVVEPPAVRAGVVALRAAIQASTFLPDLRRPLAAKLDAALAALDAGDTAAACVALADFANQVRAQRGKAIPTADADALLAEVTSLRTQLGC